MDTLEYRLFHRRHLPHYQPEGAIFFITFRLAGSLPQEALARLLEEAEATAKVLDGLIDADARLCQADLAQRRMFDKWDTALADGKYGPLWLQEHGIASLVADALHYRNGSVYELHAYCIMPNHVHLVCTPLRTANGYVSLSSILHSLKSYTAHQANQHIGRNGEFWQHESYDHMVRSDAELRRVIEYVINNPVKANLVPDWESWEWTYCKMD